MEPRAVVTKFAEQCGWVWTTVQQYRLLFEQGELRLRLLDRVASNYFRFLHTILRDYIYLQFTRITDPAETFGRENLTASYVAERIAWPPAVEGALREKLGELLDFRRKILPARNQLVVHPDLQAHASDVSFGAFPEGDETRFLQNLQEFVDIVHEQLFGCRLPLDAVTYGDASDLIICLQRGVAMEALLHREPVLCHEVLSSGEFRDA